MAKKPKSAHVRSTTTVDLGKVRKERIARFRAKKQLEGTPIPNLELAVNQLLDRALELEQV